MSAVALILHQSCLAVVYSLYFRMNLKISLLGVWGTVEAIGQFGEKQHLNDSKPYPLSIEITESFCKE